MIYVDNASDDGSEQLVRQWWKELGSAVPLYVYSELRKGKDYALELGFSKARYQFAIICDDDNWLAENYIEASYRIMIKNPRIGLLGGKGIPVFESSAPVWFNEYQTYYAVGKQSAYNGEIKHYWPRYRFIWGAGAVVNLNAYHYLQDSGFQRVLNSKDHPRVARSEDVELGLAPWLAGYKLWYDDRLIYSHYLTDNRLSWNSMLQVVKQSVSSMHYLRPYNILIYSGLENAPTDSFWQDYIWHNFKRLRQDFRSWRDFKYLFYLWLGRHPQSSDYFSKAVSWYQVTSIIRLCKGYDRIFKQIAQLQRNFSAQIS